MKTFQQRAKTTAGGAHGGRMQARTILAGLVLAGAAGLAGAHGAPGGGMGMGGPGMSHGGGTGMMGEGGMAGGGRQGAHMERMLEEVGASAEQRTQIRQIWDAARKDMQALHAGGTNHRQEMARLLAQPSIDVAAVEALRQQHAAVREQASKRMTQAMVDASRVLTPEQRQRVAERLAQRQAMMQRHQAEHRQMNGSPRN